MAGVPLQWGVRGPRRNCASTRAQRRDQLDVHMPVAALASAIAIAAAAAAAITAAAAGC